MCVYLHIHIHDAEMIDTIIEIREKVKLQLKHKRYEHTLGVAYTAACLAFIYDADPLKAELAGILHDCAKCMRDDELIAACGKAGIPLSREELLSPQVIHAKYGSYLAEQEYGITDKDILNAIRFHTTGRPDMSVLEKIIFTADYIEPMRKDLPELQYLRKLAFTDIDRCMYLILKGTMDYIAGKSSVIVPDTLAAFEWLNKERSFENGRD